MEEALAEEVAVEEADRVEAPEVPVEVREPEGAKVERVALALALPVEVRAEVAQREPPVIVVITGAMEITTATTQ